MDTVLWWHLHQPDYRDPGGATAGLPWVRMHALRAYTDLCAFALEENFGGMTINVVPSLADQLEDIAAGTCEDRHHALARAVVEGDEERYVEAFRAHAALTPRPLVPLPRLAALREQAGANSKPSLDDVTDACALFHLSWVGFTLGARDDVQKLLKQGRGYTRDDVAFLLHLSRTASAEVLERFRTAREAGLIHLTTTPYFHPILPLVIDGSSAHDATSDGGAPTFSQPADAREQIVRAARRHEELFGARPLAMWPSEGALSEAAVHLIADAGFEVAASDEELLRRSLDAHHAHDVHLHPWRHQESGLGLLFRDRALSDDWGFVYRDRRPEDAAEAFVSGVETRKDRGGSICAVILDGENPFEFYPGAGRDHLRAFAKRARDTIHLVAPEQAAQKKSAQRLKHIKTGSWIHASLDIWAGDDEDRRAWSLLRAVRAEINLDALDDNARRSAEHHLFAAEGSDWFWWYGPEFDIPDAPAFDALFRGHLRAALKFANVDHVEEQSAKDSPARAGALASLSAAERCVQLVRALDRPVFIEKVASRERRVPPWTPTATKGPYSVEHFDNRLWMANAITISANEDGGAMHRGASVLERVWVMTTTTEITIAFSARSDVEHVEVKVHGHSPAPGGGSSATVAMRELRADDERMQRDNSSLHGVVTIGWNEVGCGVDEDAAIEVTAKAGAALETRPEPALLLRRPRPSQFEA